jgi:peptidoglycan/xylan/chitin deacetylase (PgdA/CDA1 family)
LLVGDYTAHQDAKRPLPKMNEPITCLLYHRVDNSDRPFSTAPSVFRQHIEWLATRGYRTLTLDQFDHALRNPQGRPEKSLLLTFDDGFADLETRVAPVLREFGFNGVAFVITSRCAAPTIPASEYLAWPSMRTLSTEGTIEFQTHTHSHQRWALTERSSATVAADIGKSVEILEAELRVPRSHFRHIAWPFGRTCGSWEREATKIGLRSQYIVRKGAVTRENDSIRLPRLMLDGMPLSTVKLWMHTLSRPVGAAICNKVFGALRHFRQGAGYL